MDFVPVPEILNSRHRLPTVETSDLMLYLSVAIQGLLGANALTTGRSSRIEMSGVARNANMGKLQVRAAHLPSRCALSPREPPLPLLTLVDARGRRLATSSPRSASAATATSRRTRTPRSSALASATLRSPCLTTSSQGSRLA